MSCGAHSRAAQAAPAVAAVTATTTAPRALVFGLGVHTTTCWHPWREHQPGRAADRRAPLARGRWVALQLGGRGGRLQRPDWR